jgi:cbb3-type cytochrome oxidase subunit 3
MVRTLQDEVERYGPYSLAVESQYDHPMLWGSKRTGPDLARVGGKYSDQWHAAHLENPRDIVPESIMPRYPWLNETQLPTRHLGDDLRALRAVGVPYTDDMIANGRACRTLRRRHADPRVRRRPADGFGDGRARRLSPDPRQAQHRPASGGGNGPGGAAGSGEIGAMGIDHHTLVGFAKSFGLFYLMGMAAVALLYACWPSNKKRFDKAARDIIDDEDKPWR